MSPGWIIVIILVVLILLGAPNIGVSHNYGPWPSSTLAVIAIIVIILLLKDRL